MKKFLLLLPALTMVGCASVPNQVGIYKGDWLVVSSKKKVEIHSKRAKPVQVSIATQHGIKPVYLDKWTLQIVNNNKFVVCALPEWKTMDYTTHTPNTWQFLASKETKDIGYLVQRSWKFDDVVLTMPDAQARVNDIRLWRPKKKNCVIEKKVSK